MYRAIGRHVIVERIACEKTTESGLILNTAQGPDKAKIISVGNELVASGVPLEQGDIILANWNRAGRIFDEIFSVPFEEIVLVFEDE